MKAILFDFDGVLTTDATGTTSVMNYIETKTDIDREIFEKSYRKHNLDLLLGRKKHENVWDEICHEVSKSIDIKILHQSFLATPLDEKMLDIAKSLKEYGYKIGMITDNKSDRMKMILDHHQLNELFDVMSISADIGSSKKDSEIFDNTIQKLSLNYEDCVFIDNNKGNLVIPSSKGMHTLYFDHNERNHMRLIDDLNELGVRSISWL